MKSQNQSWAMVRWDEKRSWLIDGVLMVKAHQWEEEACQACEEETERWGDTGSTGTRWLS